MGCAIGLVHAVSVKRKSEDAFSNRYTVIEELGKGSYGRVHLAASTRRRKLVAVKELDLLADGEKSQKLALAASQELKVWKHINQSSYVVSLHEAFIDQRSCFFVMERCESNLIQRIDQINKYSAMAYARLFGEILHGIQHLHSRGVVHRDVKPDNFLIGSGRHGRVKISDFGFASQLPRDGSLLRGCCGTAPYMSPEMISKAGHGRNTDMWSFAVSVYVLLYSTFPYLPREQTSAAMKNTVLLGVQQPKFRHRSGRSVDVMLERFARSLFVREASLRPSVKQVIGSPLLAKLGAPATSSEADKLSAIKGHAVTRQLSDVSTHPGSPSNSQSCSSSSSTFS